MKPTHKSVLLTKCVKTTTYCEICIARCEIVKAKGDQMKTQMLVVVLLGGTWLLSLQTLHAQAAPAGQESATSSKDNEASIDKSVALLRQDLRSGKKQAIAASLQLTEAEATKFWPVYDQYAAELTKLGDQRYALIKEYANGFGTLTDKESLSLIKRSLSLDEQVAQLHSKYVPIVNQVLPGTKTATFFQLDRYINALIDVQVAGGIPAVQDQR